MSFFGNLNTFNSNTQMRVSDIQNYRPGEFLKKYD